MIEDNPDDVRLIRNIVEKNSSGPIDLINAECLSEGIKIMALSKIDVVLLDLNLPDSPPWDTISQAEQMASFVPIIVLTEMENEALASRIIFNGVQDYLIKGQFDCRMLCRSIRYAMERKRASLEKDKLFAELREALSLVLQKSNQEGG
ncbi:MAG: response regulator [Verrucomicrobia bacterium]|nr:response regulator [Verrucomicrobiota bacterium]